MIVEDLRGGRKTGLLEAPCDLSCGAWAQHAGRPEADQSRQSSITARAASPLPHSSARPVPPSSHTSTPNPYSLSTTFVNNSNFHIKEIAKFRILKNTY